MVEQKLTKKQITALEKIIQICPVLEKDIGVLEVETNWTAADRSELQKLHHLLTTLKEVRPDENEDKFFYDEAQELYYENDVN